ncbi:MAG TPA: trehalose-phosphatase [Thermoanaerobaculia bacterium]|nr:trehalose-phosphatase [Thermoanaerobaculia bacterium]
MSKTPGSSSRSRDLGDAALPPSALERWPEIEKRLRRGRPALFLDYDGTLTPIVARPELAVLDGGVRELLGRLARRFPVAVLSGRGREDVAALVGLPELVYAGSHGFDIAGPEVRHEVGEGVPAEIAATAAELERAVRGFPGVLVEPKRFTVAVHWRLARPEDLPALEGEVEGVLARHPALRRAEGKKVWELRPALAWDKGEALRWLLAAWGLDGGRGVPLYLGDDATDEDAFRAVRAVRAAAEPGVGVLVADEPRPTAASYVLRDPAEARELLERVAALPLDG